MMFRLSEISKYNKELLDLGLLYYWSVEELGNGMFLILRDHRNPKDFCLSFRLTKDMVKPFLCEDIFNYCYGWRIDTKNVFINVVQAYIEMLLRQSVQ